MITPVPETAVDSAASGPLAGGVCPRRGALPRALVILIGAAAAVIVVAGIQATAWLIGPTFMALILVIAVASTSKWTAVPTIAALSAVGLISAIAYFLAMRHAVSRVGRVAR